jgi:hypothetical protein
VTELSLPRLLFCDGAVEEVREIQVGNLLDHTTEIKWWTLNVGDRFGVVRALNS